MQIRSSGFHLIWFGALKQMLNIPTANPIDSSQLKTRNTFIAATVAVLKIMGYLAMGILIVGRI